MTCYQGIAFCEYTDPAVTDIAVEGLHGMELGDKHLRVQRASIGVTQAGGLEMGVNAMSMLAGTTSIDLDEGRVLQLLNMVTAEELIDNEDYQGMSEGYWVLDVQQRLITDQKSAKMLKKNATSTARCWR